MIVSELIEKLKGLPQDALVIVAQSCSDYQTTSIQVAEFEYSPEARSIEDSIVVEAEDTTTAVYLSSL